MATGKYMNGDEYLVEIDKQVEMLQQKLKDRLVEAQDLKDLNVKALDTSFNLQRSTKQVKKKAEKSKWITMVEYYKWVIGISVVSILLFFFLLKSFFGSNSRADLVFD